MPFQSNVPPRRWQSEALALWATEMRGVVSVVTGGGKTIFAQYCMQEFFRRHADGRVIIVVPTTSLLDQWCVALQQESNVSPTEIGTYSGEERSRDIRRISIVVINTGRQFVRQLAKSHVSMLIVDECHRAGSEINSNVLKGVFHATLGLTATPERQYDDGFERYIQPVLGRVIFSYDYETAYADNVISDFDLVNVKIDFLSDEAIQYRKLSSQIARIVQAHPNSPAYDERLKRLLQRRARVSSSALMRIPVCARIVDAHRGIRAIVFHERVEAASKIAGILAERGHSVTLYHSAIGPDLRRDNLLLFRRGICDVLVCCRALDEGLNIPEAALAVVASSTASTRQRIQRLGRVLRPASGKLKALIYTLYATESEAARLRIEECRLSSIASVAWRHGRLTSNG